MSWGRIFLIAFVAEIVWSKTHVFQGSCDDAAVLCVQLCLKISPESYECSCWNDHVLQADGVGCRLNSTLNPIWHSAEEFPDSEKYHEDEETAPIAFYGSNYAEFPLVESAYLETNITLEFKVSAQRDGILFFAGQFKGDDFISLALIGPNIMLRQDCGEGTIEDLYRGPFAVELWHNVSIVRHYCYLTEVQADGRQSMKDEAVQFQNYKGITMEEGIFVGGAPRNVEFLDSKAGTDRGITGCIRKVVVNGEVLFHSEKKINKATNIGHLEKCGAEKKDGQTKPEDVSKEDEFMEFDIATGFEDQIKAEKVKEAANRQALVGPADNFTTATPSTPARSASSTRPHSTTEVSRLKDHRLSAAFFTGSQSLSWVSPADVVDYMEISFHFKPKTQLGLLFLWQDGSRHAAIYLRQGYLLVDVNVGFDTVLLRSAEAVSLNAWHKMEFWRSGRGLLLKVDHQTWIEGELQGADSDGITEGGKFLVGGFEGATPAHLDGITGFHGCIRHLHLNGRHMKMYSRDGIQECSSSADPCASAGCPKACSVIEDAAVCLCEWPYQGAKCEHESTATLHAMNFQGHSYLEMKDGKTLNEITGDSLSLTIQLRVENKTTQQMILAFAGDHLKDDADFFRLRLTSELYVEMGMNLGYGIVDLVHPTALEPGRWHTVSVVRQKKHVTLSIDGLLPISTVSPGTSEQLNVYSSFFIGGLPTSSFGFHGCVASADIGHVAISQPSQVTSAVNIVECVP